MTELPFIDEHRRAVSAPPDVVWGAVVSLFRRQLDGAGWFARLLGCDPARGSADFSGKPGDTLPGFRVTEAEPGRRLLLAGRHRFAIYELALLFESSQLTAQTRAAFPGFKGRLYRALVIGSGGHALITRSLLRGVARRAERARIEGLGVMEDVVNPKRSATQPEGRLPADD